MQILICDDDAATRLVLRRKLEQSISGCTVQECCDGADALRVLESTMFDLVVLDVEMPVIDGIAVLESIRRSPRMSHVAVMMASKERRADVVARLIRLGISGYVLKPLRPRTLTETIEQLKIRLRLGGARRSGGPVSRLAPRTTSLIVDGEAHYRRFFVGQAHRHGPVLEAATGADALAICQRTPISIVFVGAKLGVINADLLAQRLRGDGVSRPPLIVGITDGRDGDAHAACDETIKRTLIAAMHQAELQRFIPAPGPLAGASTLIGDLSDIVMSDAIQVLGLMLDSEVTCSAADPQPEIVSSLTVTLGDQFTVTLTICMADGPARALAARLSNGDASEVTDALLLDNTSEIARLLGTRLHSLANQRGLNSELTEARATRIPAAPLQQVAEESGLSMTFVCAGIGAEIIVRVDVAEGRDAEGGGPGISLPEEAVCA